MRCWRAGTPFQSEKCCVFAGAGGCAAGALERPFRPRSIVCLQALVDAVLARWNALPQGQQPEQLGERLEELFLEASMLEAVRTDPSNALFYLYNETSKCCLSPFICPSVALVMSS